jgi:nitrate/nitrite transport system ATP-binding protein
MTAYLKLDHIDKHFDRAGTRAEVLKGINLTIDKGEFVSIIGHSGCGKSTLLNLIAGLTPVSAGAVLLENREVNAPGPERAVVFQNHSLLPWLTVYENVNLAVSKVFSRVPRARPSATTGSWPISTSCRWHTPRTSAHRKSPAA